MKYFCSVFVAFLFAFHFYGQSAIVKGVVYDDSDAPVEGASVIYRYDVSRGCQTDKNGKFQLTVPSGAVLLLVRYTSMRTDTLSLKLEENEIKVVSIKLRPFSLEKGQVTVAVGKFDKPLEEQTVTMVVMKPSLIENKNTRSIETALDQTPGLNILDGEPQIRGGSGFTFGVGAKVAVLVDDMPMLSGDAGRPEWGFVPVENISQVEIIKGAASVLSGSSALSGSIHIRTAYPTSKPLNKINLYTGMYSSPSVEGAKWWSGIPLISGANFIHSKSYKNWDIVLGGNMNYDNGYIGAPKPGPYVVDTISDFSDKQMAMKRARINFNLRKRSTKVSGLSYGLNGNIMLARTNLSFAWLDDSSGLYRAYPGAVFLQDQTIFNMDPFIQLITEAGGNHYLRTRILYNDNQMSANQDNRATTYYSDYMFKRSYAQLGGMDFIGGLTGSFVNSFANMYVGSGDPNNQLLNFSAYTQVERTINKTLNVSAGARAEYFQLNDTVTAFKPIFRCGANLKLYQETYLRASFGQGFRFPTITERFIKTGVGNFGVFPNPDLIPESSWNGEVGIKQGLKIGGVYAYFDVAAFWQEYQNTIEYMFGIWDVASAPASFAGFKFLNTGKSRVLGLDLSFAGKSKLSKNSEVNFLTGYNYIVPKTLNPDYIYAIDDINRKYSYNSTSLDSASGILKYRFLHNIKFDAEWTLKEQFSLGLSMKYFSKIVNMDAIIKDFEETTAASGGDKQNIRYMDYFYSHRFGNMIFDARVSYTVNEHHKIALVGSNVLNRSYSLRPLKIEPPRSVMLQYTLKLS
ncbi:MAG: TonB-dependent receptor [Bacteroidetes bacterium]|nr:TonB-dependent receptor [Bacteroidota bacterium]MBM3424857.1 TonB-dependent receptor [Bacteroidota bacterium]